MYSSILPYSALVKYDKFFDFHDISLILKKYFELLIKENFLNNMPFGSLSGSEVSIKKLRLLSRFRFLFILFSFY